MRCSCVVRIFCTVLGCIILHDARLFGCAEYSNVSQTALCKACYKGHTSIAKILLDDEHVDPNVADEDGWVRGAFAGNLRHKLTHDSSD